MRGVPSPALVPLPSTRRVSREVCGSRISADNDASDLRSGSAGDGDEGEGGEVHGDFPTRGNRTAEIEVLAGVPPTEQMFQWKQTNQRMQDREERGAIRQRCAPPTRTLDFCYGNLSTGYGPVPDVRIRRDTRCGVN